MERSMIQDGHMLKVKLGPDWTIKPEIVCPIAGCQARWDGSKPASAPDCWLEYIVKEFGSEFLEWWTASAGGFTGEVYLTDGAVLIEWWADSGEDAETFWRPLDDRHPTVPWQRAAEYAAPIPA